MPVPVKRPDTFDYLAIPDELVPRYEALGWVRVAPIVDPAPAPAVEPLRGTALIAALKNAGLSTSGTVAEKLARLAACSNPTPEEQS
jgi:hypothetical protein